jgi:hypothetical protein
MAFTEFCCRSGGSNLNAGTRTGNSTEPGTSADLTYASGSWVNATRVFTVASGNPVTDGVAIGDYVAIDTGGATAAMVARVTAVSSTTITLNSTFAGANPANGTYTLRVGGAWKGPNGTDSFPFNLANLASITNTSLYIVRCNLKNDATYNITASIAINFTAVANMVYSGYATSYGDCFCAVIDGGTSGASYSLLTTGTGSRWAAFSYLHLQNNGATGTADAIILSGVNAGSTTFDHVTVSDVRGSGFTCGSAGAYVLSDCEAYNCNQSNTANKGGFSVVSAGVSLIRPVAHHNTGSNNAGITGQNLTSVTVVDGLLSNNRYGVYCQSNTMGLMALHTSFFSNEYGIFCPNVPSGVAHIRGCSFCKSATYDIYSGNPSSWSIINCGFGSGVMAAGTASINSVNWGTITGSVTYASGVTPWTDPDNGDFRVTLDAAKAVDAITYQQQMSGWSGTIAYKDIAAAQSAASGGSTLIVIED